MNSLNKLYDFLVECGCDKHDKVITLIKACIEMGIRRGADITSNLAELGCNKQHVGIKLSLHGDGSDDQYWTVDADGLYSLVKD
ncbi:hypothetical protein [Parasphingorhabdus sp.]|uniref:hypothetical protein n=1 Tax=Parasphingorhabdus sp. TaxID=2709688 RepID=UPI00300108A6